MHRKCATCAMHQLMEFEFLTYTGVFGIWNFIGNDDELWFGLRCMDLHTPMKP